jgi:1-deoxy-D-xylulose-5-phosphate synthase
MVLERIESPADLKALSVDELRTLADEIRAFIVEKVSVTGGHLGSNLGAVEITLALHRVFDSPHDIVLWDTGHQAYAHKIVTGRRDRFDQLRQQGGLSGYPNRRESPHDWVENSHASTILSYAHGLSSALHLRGMDRPTPGGAPRRIVAVVGDGALTGGMAYEALNNLGHSGRRVVIVLNDNGRSYAPTVSRLSESLTRLRLHPSYVQARSRVKALVRDLPAVGGLAYSGLQSMALALRELVEPHVFFEALGVRYTGPIDGHDIAGLEHALRNAAEWDGPIVVHVLTQKGKGYPPAEEDEVQCLHDLKVPSAIDRHGVPARSYTDVFGASILDWAERDERVVAITAAMPGPTGLLPFQARFPERFLDVGIAEQHAVTAAAGLAMGGMRPVVAEVEGRKGKIRKVRQKIEERKKKNKGKNERKVRVRRQID